MGINTTFVCDICGKSIESGRSRPSVSYYHAHEVRPISMAVGYPFALPGSIVREEEPCERIFHKECLDRVCKKEGDGA